MNRTAADFPRLQTTCACGHPEWDHYLLTQASGAACDSGGCLCPTFSAADQ